MTSTAIDELEHAIPEHLEKERSVPSKLPEHYQPPFPAYCARFPESFQGLILAVIGVQQKKKREDKYHRMLLEFVHEKAHDAGPEHWELASSTDHKGYENIAILAYWTNQNAYDAWKDKSGFQSFWHFLEPNDEVGWFQETFSPTIDRFETVFSNNAVPEGASHMQEKISGPLREHAYWGSMRDRLPAAQTDALDGDVFSSERSQATVDTKKQRIRVPGRQNLAVIRSGQDWSGTDAEERELYLKTMHPVLIKGMDFLQDHGSDVGCFCNRFMDIVNLEDPCNPSERTFGLGFFRDLAALEGWSRQHPKHVAIFGRFLQYAAELGNDVKLRLYHEVMVLQPEQQFFEFVGCHEDTGMLACI